MEFENIAYFWGKIVLVVSLQGTISPFDCPLQCSKQMNQILYSRAGHCDEICSPYVRGMVIGEVCAFRVL